MDTITAIVEGEIIYASRQPIQKVKVALRSQTDSFSVQSTVGLFNFAHIPSGIYKVFVGDDTLYPVVGDSVALGSGDISQLKLGINGSSK